MDLVKVKTEDVTKTFDKCGMNALYDSTNGEIKQITMHTKDGPIIFSPTQYGNGIEIMRPKVETEKYYNVTVKTKDRYFSYELAHKSGDCELSLQEEISHHSDDCTKVTVSKFDRPINQTKTERIN